MGWIKDWVNSMFRWFKNKILMPIINWIVDLIETITAELRAMRHQLSKDIAKWLDNDFRFVLTIIAAIALGFVWPKIWLSLVDIKEKTLMSAMVQSIREGINKITSSMMWINIQTLHIILRTVWPDYVNMMGDFAQAVAGLADELGEGSGYILAYFQLNYAIAYNTGALLGLDPKASELTAYKAVADFTRQVDKNFRRYAYDPGLIYKDFLEYVVIPAAEDLRESQQGLVSEVRENYERNVEMDTSITAMETAVDDFIDAMPDEIADQIQKRWEPIKTWMEENYHYLVDEVLEITGGIKEALELRQAHIEQANAYAMEKLDDPLNSMLNYELANEEQQATLREHNLKMIAEAVTEEAEVISEVQKPTYDKTFALLRNLIRSIESPEILQYESATMIPVGKESIAVYENWFIGEY